MALSTVQTMLRYAQNGGYAVAAVNAENMEMVRAILAAAEEHHIREGVAVQEAQAMKQRFECRKDSQWFGWQPGQGFLRL